MLGQLLLCVSLRDLRGESSCKDADVLTIEWMNQQWGLLAEKALSWPAQRAAIVADVHFGKSAAFRARGVPVPEATTSQDLARLTHIVQQTRCERLIVLGDLLHARDGRGDATMRAVRLWRDLHPSLHILLVRGNHDHDAGDPPADWRIECVDEPHSSGGVWLRHAHQHSGDALTPAHSHRESRCVIAGHVHPCVHVHDSEGGPSARVPCFVFSQRSILLPAFGSFTGTHPVRPRAGDRVFAVAHNEVSEIATVAV